MAGRPLGVHALLFYQEGVKVKEGWGDAVGPVYARSGERERSFLGDPPRVRVCVCVREGVGARAIANQGPLNPPLLVKICSKSKDLVTSPGAQSIADHV